MMFIVRLCYPPDLSSGGFAYTAVSGTIIITCSSLDVHLPVWWMNRKAGLNTDSGDLRLISSYFRQFACHLGAGLLFRNTRNDGLFQ